MKMNEPRGEEEMAPRMAMCTGGGGAVDMTDLSDDDPQLLTCSRCCEKLYP